MPHMPDAPAQRVDSPIAPFSELDILVGIPTVRRALQLPTEQSLLWRSVRSLLDKSRPEQLRLGILIHNLDPEPQRHEAAQRLGELVRDWGAEPLLRIAQPSRQSVRDLERDAPAQLARDRGLDADYPLRRWQRRLACDRILLLQGMAEYRAWGYLMLEDDSSLAARDGWHRLKRDAPHQLALRNGVLRLRAYSHFPRLAARYTHRSGATAVLFDKPRLRWYLEAIRHSLREHHGTEPIDVLLDRHPAPLDKHNLYLFRHLGTRHSTHPDKAVYPHPRSLLAEDCNVFKSALIGLLRPHAPRLSTALLKIHARIIPSARLNKRRSP